MLAEKSSLQNVAFVIQLIQTGKFRWYQRVTESKFNSWKRQEPQQYQHVTRIHGEETKTTNAHRHVSQTPCKAWNYHTEFAQLTRRLTEIQQCKAPYRSNVLSNVTDRGNNGCRAGKDGNLTTSDSVKQATPKKQQMHSEFKTVKYSNSSNR